jgi:hypothetical protein
VLNCEPELHDDLGLTAGEIEKDRGWDDLPEGALVIKDHAHALAAGLSGTVKVTAPESKVTFGVPNPYASWIATKPGVPMRALIFGYDRGTPMPGMDAAPGRRVGFFLGHDTAVDLTESGWALFDAAVRWCTGD